MAGVGAGGDPKVVQNKAKWLPLSRINHMDGLELASARDKAFNPSRICPTVGYIVHSMNENAVLPP
jgi:hypothetical protein